MSKRYSEQEVREFFILRFKRMPEHDLVYFKEWVERFHTGYPERFMDSESKKAFEKVIHARRKIGRIE